MNDDGWLIDWLVKCSRYRDHRGQKKKQTRKTSEPSSFAIQISLNESKINPVRIYIIRSISILQEVQISIHNGTRDGMDPNFAHCPVIQWSIDRSIEWLIDWLGSPCYYVGSMDGSINQSINQSMDQPMNEWIDQSNDQKMNETYLTPNEVFFFEF